MYLKKKEKQTSHCISAGVFLSLSGLNYSNNSVVDLADIGYNNTTGLICHTNYSTGHGYKLGSRWWYPGNRTVTSNRSSTEPFSRTRGNMTISLYHRTNNTEENPPVGIYYCDFRNKTTRIILQEIYVGVYSIDKGKIILDFRSCCYFVICVNRPTINFIHNLRPFDRNSDLCV